MHLCHTSNGVTVVREFLSLVVFASVETGKRHFSIGKVEGDGYIFGGYLVSTHFDHC